MDTVLSQLNAVPGVIGSFVCDREGRLLANAFPPLFDTAMLAEAARCLADGAAGLELTPESSHGLELRFGEARILLRPLPDATLLVLCGKATNLQFLALSASVAVGKLGKLCRAAALPAPGAPQLSTPPPAARPSPPAASAPAAHARAAGAHVPLPTKGLEELHKRLGETGEHPAPRPPRR
jgi:predicted regulator of Ras-like GTPase activity (Roadblock/LC7/MglB family)